ncbi:alpha-amylase family glycosyl hydrolase [Halobacillus massiliensis]|uniref:alpha-amylase family glycosyl hydrolase n=1 Tax=Halobacillus massiliensis TaxID=1926286 RepID=UPI0009E4D179|nr:alpha-amylase family glycosyl hydrolase [Halobacillus massiliensis]
MRRSIQFLTIMLFLFSGVHMVNAAEKEERQWQDESMYYIMVDRFMNGDSENDSNIDTKNPKAYHGGDIKGVIEQLDYIKEMGFTSIILSPIMENEEGGFHGFWINDYRAVEENFGTIEDAERLVKEAHERDIKVVFDIVVTHTSPNHPWVQENSGWYTGSQETTGGLSSLPQLDTDNREVQEYFTETAKWWIQQTNVDGFHLQGTPGDSFVESFSTSLSEVKEDVLIMTKGTSNVEGGDNVSYTLPDYSTEAAEAFQSPDNELGNFSESDNMKNHYIDMPLTDRLTRLAVEEGENPVTRWKLALTHLFTYPGIPVTVYGTELPLDEGKEMENGQMMSFKGGNAEVGQIVEKLNSVRQEFPALARGSYKELYNDNGMTLYERQLEDQTLVVAINNSSQTRSAELTHLPDDQQLRGLMQDGLIHQSEDGSYRVGMDRETSDIFVVEENQGWNWLFIGFVGGVLLLFVIAIIALSIKSKRNAGN